MLIVAAAIVFDLGARFRAAQILVPIREANAELRSHAGRTAYMVTARPSDQGNSFLPAAAAAEADSTAPSDSSADSESSSDRDIDELLNSDSPAATFQQVYLLLKDQFVDRIDSDRPLADGAASALVASLDEPNSRFVDRPEREALEQQSGGLFAGIGAEFTVRKVVETDGLVDRQITVIDPLPGSPAEKAGLRTGDVITSIDGHWIVSYDPFQAQNSLFKKLTNDPYNLDKAISATEKRLGAGYSLDKAQGLLDITSKYPLKLEITRKGTPKPIDVTLDVSAPMQVKDIEYRTLADGNGYIDFNAITDSTAVDFSNAMAALGKPKGLVIDLRDCPGGEIDPAAEIAKAMAPDKSFGEMDVRKDQSTTDAKGPIPTRTRTVDDPGVLTIPNIAYTGPISVLVNKGTANAAELLSAFLHDRMGARIVGTSTFGDALAQSLFPLSDGTAIVLTTGMLKTDNGVAFNGFGLAPEYALSDPGHAGDGDMDPGMTKALALLALGPVSPAIAQQHPVIAAKGPAKAAPTAVASGSIVLPGKDAALFWPRIRIRPDGNTAGHGGKAE